MGDTIILDFKKVNGFTFELESICKILVLGEEQLCTDPTLDTQI